MFINKRYSPIHQRNFMSFGEYSKEDYTLTVKEKRREFIFKYFSTELELIFQSLKSEASKMKNCHYEVKFVCPDHFDINVTEMRLRDYFRDLGYETLAEPRKSEEQIITLTLT